MTGNTGGGGGVVVVPPTPTDLTSYVTNSALNTLIANYATTIQTKALLTGGGLFRRIIHLNGNTAQNEMTDALWQSFVMFGPIGTSELYMIVTPPSSAMATSQLWNTWTPANVHPNYDTTFADNHLAPSGAWTLLINTSTTRSIRIGLKKPGVSYWGKLYNGTPINVINTQTEDFLPPGGVMLLMCVGITGPAIFVAPLTGDGVDQLKTRVQALESGGVPSSGVQRASKESAGLYRVSNIQGQTIVCQPTEVVPGQTYALCMWETPSLNLSVPDTNVFSFQVVNTGTVPLRLNGIGSPNYGDAVFVNGNTGVYQYGPTSTMTIPVGGRHEVVRMGWSDSGVRLKAGGFNIEGLQTTAYFEYDC